MAGLIKQGVQPALVDLEASPLGDIERAFTGANAVVFAAGSAEGESSTVDKKGVQRTVRAAMKQKARRYVAISALGTSTPIPEAFNTPEMKEYYSAKRTANKVIKNSSLEWTILEPGELTDGKATGKVALATDGIENKDVTRADLAALTIAVLEDPRSVARIIQAVGGKATIKTALNRVLKD